MKCVSHHTEPLPVPGDNEGAALYDFENPYDPEDDPDLELTLTASRLSSERNVDKAVAYRKDIY
jgi:hypothetical protein